MISLPSVSTRVNVVSPLLQAKHPTSKKVEIEGVSRATPPLPNKQTGMDFFNAALEKVTSKMNTASLQEKWSLLGNHLLTYTSNHESHQCATVCTEAFNLYRTHTSKLRQPCSHLTAAACMMCDQMFSWLIKFQPQFTELAQQVREVLLQTIYSEEDQQEPSLIKRTLCDVPELTVETIEAEIGRFTFGTYFEECRMLRRQLSDLGVQEASTKQATDEVRQQLKYWKECYLSKVFTGWRGAINHEKRLRRSFDDFKDQYVSKMKSIDDENKKLKDDNSQVQDLRFEVSQLNKAISSKQEEIAQFVSQVKSLQSANLLAKSEIDHQVKQNMQLTVLKTEADSRTKKVLEEKEHIVSLLCLVVNKCFGSYQQIKRLTNYNHLLQEEATGEALLDLFNSVVSEVDPKYTITSFATGQTIVDSLTAFIHALTPHYFSGSDFNATVRDTDLVMKSKKVLSGMSNFSIPFIPISEEDIIKGDNEVGLRLLLAMVFLKFTDPDLCTHNPSEFGIPMGQRKDNSLCGRIYADLENPFNRLKLSSCMDYTGRRWEEESSSILQLMDTHIQWRIFTFTNVCNQISELHKIKDFVVDTEEKQNAEDITRLFYRLSPNLISRWVDGHENVEAAMQGIRDILTENLSKLNSVYLYYSALSKMHAKRNSGNMRFEEFWRFCNDCHLAGKYGFDRDEISTMFRDVNARLSDSYFNLEDAEESTDDELSKQEWIEILVHFASRWNYRKKGRGRKESLSAANTFIGNLEIMITKKIIPNANMVERDSFKTMMHNETVQTVVSAYRRVLLDIFNKFKTPETSESEFPWMSVEDFIVMLNRANLIDVNMSSTSAKEIFYKVQDDTQLTFLEFGEALMGVACFRNPSPFTPPAKKFQLLMDGLMATFSSSFRWRAINL